MEKTTNTEKIEIKNPTPELKEFFENWQEKKRLQLKEMRMKFDHVMPVEGLEEIKAVEMAMEMWKINGMPMNPAVDRLLERAKEYREKLEK